MWTVIDINVALCRHTRSFALRVQATVESAWFILVHSAELLLVFANFSLLHACVHSRGLHASRVANKWIAPRRQLIQPSRRRAEPAHDHVTEGGQRWWRSWPTQPTTVHRQRSDNQDPWPRRFRDRLPPAGQAAGRPTRWPAMVGPSPRIAYGGLHVGRLGVGKHDLRRSDSRVTSCAYSLHRRCDWRKSRSWWTYDAARGSTDTQH